MVQVAKQLLAQSRAEIKLLKEQVAKQMLAHSQGLKYLARVFIHIHASYNSYVLTSHPKNIFGKFQNTKKNMDEIMLENLPMLQREEKSHTI